MKKILHVLASNKFSGAENVVCTIIDNFKDEIHMAYCSPDGTIKDVLQKRKINFYPLKKMNLIELKKVIKKYQPDIIHAHDYTASVLTAFSGFKGKIISHLHNNVPFAKTWNLKTLLYNFTIKKYDKVVGVSNQVLEEAIFRKKLKNKYTTIYNYVDKERILKNSKEVICDAYFDLFFIGRLTEQKDPLLFIEIVNEVKKMRPKISAVMIGEGELKFDCISLIEKYNLTNNIKLVGFVSNPFPIIKNCKIGVMPSKWEGFGLTAIESMILDKPVLNSGVGGLKEIFNGNSIFLCSDINQYSTKIEELLRNDQLYSNYSSDAAKMVLDYTDLKKYKKALEKIY